MNGYLIGLLIGLPVVLAGFLLLNRNRALQKAGVILMAAVLLGSAGLALSMRTAIVSMPAGLADLGLPLSVVANLAVLAGLAYLSRAWKNRWIGGLLVVQAGMLIWLAVSGRGVSQYGFFVLDHLALLMLLLVNGTGALVLLFSLKYMERHEQRRYLGDEQQHHRPDNARLEVGPIARPDIRPQMRERPEQRGFLGIQIGGCRRLGVVQRLVGVSGIEIGH